MEIFLLITILILIGIVVHQGKEIRELEKKPLMRSELYAKKLIHERKENKWNY